MYNDKIVKKNNQRKKYRMILNFQTHDPGY